VSPTLNNKYLDRCARKGNGTIKMLLLAGTVRADRSSLQCSVAEDKENIAMQRRSREVEQWIEKRLVGVNLLRKLV
jgi:hypothetical protein